MDPQNDSLSLLAGLAVVIFGLLAFLAPFLILLIGGLVGAAREKSHFEDLARRESALAGFLITDLSPLDSVEQGQLLGRLVDLTGNLVEAFHAPVSGVIALVHAKPLVDSGEPLFLITQRKG